MHRSLFRLFVQALALFAMWLDRGSTSRGHWSSRCSLCLWSLHWTLGSGICGAWRFRSPAAISRCVGKARCQRMTLGEWHKCWYHSKRRLRRTDKHLVDPKMRRWQTGLHEDDSV